MTPSKRPLRPATTLAILSLIAAASPAAGEGLRIIVGDLADPAAASGFTHRVEDAARRFCDGRYLPMELDKLAACRTAIREEALAALTPAQREALAHSLGAQHRLASVAEPATSGQPN